MHAQFFSAGNDPSSARYRHIRSPHFDLIYARGTDSLAREYVLGLERQYPRVAADIGYAPNAGCKKPLPVILHSYTSSANGMMMYAPRRMELYSVMDAYDPDPMPWIENLTIHEQRHSSQLQFAREGGRRWLRWCIGDLADVAWWAFYPGIAISEGDAVVAETALSRFGRGRTSDFLEYMRVCFDAGDWRDYYRWCYGSVKQYAPDHYRLGYLYMAGMRTLYDDPLFTRHCYDNISSHRFFNLQRTAAELSGKSFSGTFRDVEEHFRDMWAENDAQRGPFSVGVPLTRYGRRFVEYTKAAGLGTDIYAVKTGLEASVSLVCIDSCGKETRLRPFSSSTSDLMASHDGNKLWWSEYRADPRWELAGTSVIRRMDMASGKIATVMRGRRLYNPCPSPGSDEVSVTEYPFEGGSRVLVISEDGMVMRGYGAPAGMQVVQTAWLDGAIYASAITDDGFGVFCVSDGFREVLPPVSTKIKELRAHDGALYLVSDKNGADELYCLREGVLTRVTSTRYGGREFIFNPSGTSLTFASLSPDGRMLHRISCDSLSPVRVGWHDIWRNPIAETLSAQEDSLLSAVPENVPSHGEPRRYGKAAHLLRLHSWLPLYFDYDAVEDLSFSTFTHAASLGAMAFFQNSLGTATGIAGFSARPGAGKGWDNALDLRFNYTGWYPVIESRLSLGGNPHLYSISHKEDYKTVGSVLSKPSVTFSTEVYVPLKFNSRGWLRGVVPQISYSVGNSVFDRDPMEQPEKGSYFRKIAVDGVPLQNLSASLRAYVMLPVARAGVYPRLGVGAEAGAGGRPGLAGIYAPSIYGFVYGYLPGLLPEHGLRLSAISQKQLRPEDFYFHEQRVSVIPRGYASCSGALGRYMADNYPFQSKLTADYMMSVLPVDWSGLGPVAYVRNFEAGVHWDGMPMGSDGILMSAGASLTACLGNILWIPFDTKIGISWSCNFGPSYAGVKDAGVPLQRHYAGMTFSIDY